MHGVGDLHAREALLKPEPHMPTPAGDERGAGAELAQDTFVEETTQPNLLLRALSGDAFATLQPHMERVEISLLEVLTEAGAPYEHVYFPETGVISIVNR